MSWVAPAKPELETATMMDHDEMIALAHLLDKFMLDEDHGGEGGPYDAVESVAEVFSLLDDERILRPSTIPDQFKVVRYVGVRADAHRDSIDDR